MKTWKKIEETKKRTTEIHGLKKRNEDKVQKVSEQSSDCYQSNPKFLMCKTMFMCRLENSRPATEHRVLEDEQPEQLRAAETAAGREA
jgi:hypothetical protein